ncbi:MAG TPA: hypothetical protein O0X50_03945, partial [Methanocorpusculum sp.]|nr:hypothetical protein [Methanocorpusculum sp.]
MKKSKPDITELVDELNELKLFQMAATLDSLYASPDFGKIDRIELIRRIVDSEYVTKVDQRYQNRLKRAHLLGGPQSIANCKDSSARSYLPADITATLSTMRF